MSIKDQVTQAMKNAMKAQDSLTLNAMRMLLAEIEKREIDKRSELDDAECQKAVSTLIKQRQDSIDAFKKGGRDDLVEKETKELNLLKQFMPTQLTPMEMEALVTNAISETGAKGPADIGKVMKAALAKAQGRADGKMVNELARQKLMSSSIAT